MPAAGSSTPSRLGPSWPAGKPLGAGRFRFGELDRVLAFSGEELEFEICGEDPAPDVLRLVVRYANETSWDFLVRVRTDGHVLSVEDDPERPSARDLEKLAGQIARELAGEPLDLLCTITRARDARECLESNLLELARRRTWLVRLDEDIDRLESELDTLSESLGPELEPAIALLAGRGPRAQTAKISAVLSASPRTSSYAIARCGRLELAIKPRPGQSDQFTIFVSAPYKVKPCELSRTASGFSSEDAPGWHPGEVENARQAAASLLADEDFERLRRIFEAASLTNQIASRHEEIDQLAPEYEEISASIAGLRRADRRASDQIAASLIPVGVAFGLIEQLPLDFELPD